VILYTDVLKAVRRLSVMPIELLTA